mgnify:CR=1 FL=1
MQHKLQGGYKPKKDINNIASDIAPPKNGSSAVPPKIEANIKIVLSRSGLTSEEFTAALTKIIAEYKNKEKS